MILRRNLGSTLTTCILLLGAVACGDSTITGVSETPPDDLIGGWSATSLNFTPSSGGPSVDVVTFGNGLSLTLEIRADFTYTITEMEGGAGLVTSVENGVFTLIEGVLTLANEGNLDESEPFDIQVLTSTALTLFKADDQFDFNDDGTETPASIEAVFVKQ